MSLVDALEAPLVILFAFLIYLRPVFKVLPLADLNRRLHGANNLELELAPSKVLCIQSLELVDGFSADAFQYQTAVGGMVGGFPVQYRPVTFIE